MFQSKHPWATNFYDYCVRGREWSWHTFGTPADGRDEKGPLDHLKKEIQEIEADSKDLGEWVDAIILSIDGYHRAGGRSSHLLDDLFAKQEKNFARTWPDWRKTEPGKAIEHVRGSHD